MFGCAIVILQRQIAIARKQIDVLRDLIDMIYILEKAKQYFLSASSAGHIS